MKKLFVVIFLFVFLNFNVEAKSGCCSHHGGVVGCSSSGRQVCADGTLSPSCTCTPPLIYGCTDYKAKNYNARANRDNGSCLYDIKGCMNQEAINYNKRANIPDGSCQFQSIEMVIVEQEYNVTYKESEDLKEGEEKLEQKGVIGKTKEIYNVIKDEQGNYLEKNLKSSELIQECQDEIVLIPSKTSETKESNFLVSILQIGYIAGIVFIFISIQKESYPNTIIAAIKNSKKGKIIYYILYYLFVIPVYIDTFIIISSMLKKKKQI